MTASVKSKNNFGSSMKAGCVWRGPCGHREVGLMALATSQAKDNKINQAVVVVGRGKSGGNTSGRT